MVQKLQGFQVAPGLVSEIRFRQPFQATLTTFDDGHSLHSSGPAVSDCNSTHTGPDINRQYHTWIQTINYDERCGAHRDEAKYTSTAHTIHGSEQETMTRGGENEAKYLAWSHVLRDPDPSRGRKAPSQTWLDFQGSCPSQSSILPAVFVRSKRILQREASNTYFFLVRQFQGIAQGMTVSPRSSEFRFKRTEAVRGRPLTKVDFRRRSTLSGQPQPEWHATYSHPTCVIECGHERRGAPCTPWQSRLRLVYELVRSPGQTAPNWDGPLLGWLLFSCFPA
ncbi:hypothetical protein HD554DRAFT_1100207 [Boletus coccyginus]|nr:hypothetical protein HD554DRAFT_1100207 [Boletus coccyginus]